MDFGFNPASKDEPIVFGARRPGHNSRSVSLESVLRWIEFMKSRGIKRVVCLLPKSQLDYYEGIPGGLLKLYNNEFGEENVLSAPVEDFHLPEPNKLKQILDFLKNSDKMKEKVVVHCSGGLGRTGVVLAAWLAHGRGLSEKEALEAVIATGRNPYEAVECGNATEEDLKALLTIKSID